MQKKMKIRKLFLVVLGVMVIAAMGKFIFNTVVFQSTGLVLETRTHLKLARESIEWFEQETGKLPNSISEMGEYSAKKMETEVHEEDIVELVFIFLGEANRMAEVISCPRGEKNRNVYDALNGKGGWYYNKETGEVRVNLNKPVKHYLKFYKGKRKDEIPADW